MRSEASMCRNKIVNAGMKRLVPQCERTFEVPLSDLVSRASKANHVPLIVKKICFLQNRHKYLHVALVAKITLEGLVTSVPLERVFRLRV
ncbi:hypothetical protein DPMN_169499 [Dreissena polymorpha]|uniref:Uncharacterized protein n=1 Tax=Dreissena polymorpha TaxID=45954 RepID=A0A9D4DY14_DREPO|nr:hypothetical protein DPMN_169499 [Dreissena polymorpha]